MQQRLVLPPPSPRAEHAQRKIVRTLASHSFVAYAVFLMAVLALSRPLIHAFASGSLLQVALYVALILVVYGVLGGVLCVSFVDKLVDWPPPAHNVRFHGGRFTATWVVSAPRVLVDVSRTWRRGSRRL